MLTSGLHPMPPNQACPLCGRMLACQLSNETSSKQPGGQETAIVVLRSIRGGRALQRFVDERRGAQDGPNRGSGVMSHATNERRARVLGRLCL